MQANEQRIFGLELYALALPLLDGLALAYLIVDRSYDADPLVAILAARGTQVVVPSCRKRRHLRTVDGSRYAERYPVERLFSRPKQFRRLATCYDRLNAHFLALLFCGCATVTS